MLRKVNFYKNKIAEAAGYDKMTTIIDIYLKNGKKIKKVVILFIFLK